MIYTTLKKIRVHGPCTSGWAKLLKHLGKAQADDELLALTTILESNGLDDALWCLRSVEGYNREKRLFAVACARRVQHLMTDQRPIAALDVAERYAHGQATDEELSAAVYAALDAADAAWDAALDAAWAAAWAASWAAWTAWDAVTNAARSAGRASAWAASDAATNAAWAAEIDWQTAEFRRIFCTDEVMT